jgi:branched-chain amino acid aminotransferase
MVAGLPYDDRDGVIWLNGTLVPWRDAKLHVLTHSLHYGSAVFEGERCYHGQVFKLREHTERLFVSARLLGYELPYDLATLEQATKQVVALNQLADGYIRPIAWRGAEVLGVAGGGAKIHVAIAAFPWGPYYSEEAKLNGIRLMTSSWSRPSPKTAPTASKAAGLYMICTLSKDAAMSAGFDDALMYDYRGQVAEATGANIFLVKNGELHTPTPDCFLDGITRKTVVELAQQRAIRVHERAVFPEELKTADEIFLTGTAVEVTPVGMIDGQRYSVGPVTRQMQADFAALTAGL